MHPDHAMPATKVWHTEKEGLAWLQCNRLHYSRSSKQPDAKSVVTAKEVDRDLVVLLEDFFVLPHSRVVWWPDYRPTIQIEHDEYKIPDR